MSTKCTVIECSECKRTYKRIYELRRHVKAVHSEKLQVIAPLNKGKIFEFTCIQCNKHFSHQRNFKCHLKTHFLDKLDNSTLLKSRQKCALCDFTAKFKDNFCKHYTEVHNIQIESEIVKFNTINDFIQWKNDFETNTVSKFVKEKGPQPKIINYICHRSGVFKSESKGKRRLKTQGSNKINGFCPARLKVVIEDNGCCTGYLIKTHVGHQENESKIFIDKKQIEANAIFEKNSNKSSSSSGELTVIEKIRKMRENFLDSLSKIKTDKECEALQKLMAPIEPTLSALRESRQSSFRSKIHERPNKKIINQRRLYSTRKKRTTTRKQCV